MAKNVVYKPIQEPTFIPQVEQRLAEIPPYEDRGVKYQGKYKIQQTETRYELKAQQYKQYYQANAAGTTDYIARDNPDKVIFCCSRIILTWYWAANATAEPFNLYDGYYIGGVSPQLQMTVSRAERGKTLIIDLPVPIRFTADRIGFDCGNGGAAGDYMNFTLLGWEEQI